MTLTRPLRLRPGVILAIVLVIARYLVPLIAPDAEIAEMPLVVLAMLSGVFLGVAIVLWWLLFSRAPWPERLAAVVLMILGVFVTRLVVHESIRGGHMGMMLVLYSVPVLAVALVIWAVLTHRMPEAIRRATMVAAIVLACVPFTLIRHGRRHRLGFRAALALDADTRRTSVGGGEGGTCRGSPGTRTGSRACGGTPGRSATRADSLSTPRRRHQGTTAPDAPAPAVVSAAEWPGFRGAQSRQRHSPASASTPTGRHRRQRRCGASRSDRAGHPLP